MFQEATTTSIVSINILKKLEKYTKFKPLLINYIICNNYRKKSMIRYLLNTIFNNHIINF